MTVRLSAVARETLASSGETRRSLGEGGKPDTTAHPGVERFVPSPNISTTPVHVNDGGFQRFIVGLAKRVNPATGEIILSDDDQEAIAHYAFDFKQRGSQTRLINIFGRTLGTQLGRESGD